MISNLFNVYVYAPILDALIFIYKNIAFHNLGFSIVILTLIVRIVLFPIFYKSAKDQTIMQEIQPKIKDIQQSMKHDKEAQAKALMELYKEHKLNPFSGFFLLLIQLPVFFALFRIFSHGLTNSIFDKTTFFGLIDLSEKSLILAIVAAAFQYVQGKISIPSRNEQKDVAASMGKIMIILGPAITLAVLSSLPSALGVYWIISTIFSIGQQFYINKTIRKEKHTS